MTTRDPNRPPQAAPPSRSDRPVVLVIDDDEIGRALLCEVVEPAAARIIEASSPIGATRTVTTERVDVVVLDVEMPNLRGDALTKLLRQNARLKHVAVVLVSGCRPEELEACARACAADSWVSKRNVRTDLILALLTAWQVARGRAAERKLGSDTPDTGVPVATVKKQGRDQR